MTMQMTPVKLIEFDNVLITDADGIVLFYDAADLNLLSDLNIDPNTMIGTKVTDLYEGLTDENSTIMQVLRSGRPVITDQFKLTTRGGNEMTEISANYPIMNGSEVIGCVELSKFIYPQGLAHRVSEISKHKLLRKNQTQYTIDDLITQNPRMLAIKDKLPRIAQNDSSVLIYGKTGTGKEIIAQSIHNLSKRVNKPFVSVNCAGIPSNLMESILFGAVKGSYTGAVDSEGLFETASGGTLFLDEINSLDISLQAKLLKAVEEKQIRRIGSSKIIPLDLKIITAVNEEPHQIIDNHTFRADLYYRLGVVQIDLPPLRQRPEDIFLLVEHYIRYFNQHMPVHVKAIDEAVLTAFLNYSWPGNVRELRNAIEMAFNQVNTEQITLFDIPDRIRYFEREAEQFSQVMAHVSNKPLTLAALKESYEIQTVQLIQQTLKETHQNVSEAARRLGVSKELLKYKAEKYGLK